jgi:hypothetical protein
VALATSVAFASLSTVAFTDGSADPHYTVGVHSDPIVPRFDVDPLIVSGTHKLFGLVVRGMTLPGSRIRAWRGCAGECPLPLRLRSKRNGVRRYRIESFSNATFSFGDILYVLVNAPWRRDHGARLSGRLYRGKLVRDPAGGPRDTAIRQIGPLLCTPPDADYRAGIDCDRVRAG